MANPAPALQLEADTPDPVLDDSTVAAMLAYLAPNLANGHTFCRPYQSTWPSLATDDLGLVQL